MKNKITKLVSGGLIFCSAIFTNWISANPKSLYIPAIALCIWGSWMILSVVHTYVSKEEVRIAGTKQNSSDVSLLPITLTPSDLTSATPNPSSAQMQAASPPSQTFNVTSNSQQGGITAGIVYGNRPQRVISDEMKVKFMQSLNGAPRGRIRFSAENHDDECTNFVIQIANLLKSIGYDVPNGCAPCITSGLNGISITFLSEQKEPPCVMPIKKAFETIGIPIRLVTGMGDEGEITIVVCPP